MKTQSLFLSTLLYLLLLGVVSCKKDDPAPTPTPAPAPVTKSSAKAITGFASNALSPVVVAGVVDATAKTISATVASGTDVTKLVPTITLSDKATVSPATGAAQDFSKAVTYTVTAEDGSTQAYTATVTVDKPVYNGTVYIGNLDGYFYALDALTGAKKWEFQDDEVYGWQASPTVVDGIVYASIRGGGSQVGVYGLDALTGARKWKAAKTFITESSPAVANGLLYVGSEGGGFNAFDLKTGDLKWGVSEVTTVNSSPTVVNGIVYIGSGIFGTDSQNLYAFDALTGAKKWAFPTPDGGTYYSSPMVANGMVYVGGGGTFYAVDAVTGAEKWKAKPDIGNLIWSGPVVATGLVYIGIGKKVFAFDAATGAKKWEYETGRTIDHSSPCVVAKDGTVHHAGISGMVQ